MSSHDAAGEFVWHELLTTDPGSAIDFYTGLLGWGTTRQDVRTEDGGSEPYDMFTNGETPLAGVMRLPDEAQDGGTGPAWLPYVGTADVDGTAGRAGEMGADTRVAPTDIPEVGRFAVLADPWGGLFALYTPLGPGEPRRVPAPGEFSWHELATTDARAALAFYSELFGWEALDEHGMGEMGPYRIFGTGGVPLGGMFDLPQGSPHWLSYVQVRDADRSAGDVEERGGDVLNGPMEVPGGDRIAQCRDPQGAMFAVHAKAPATV